MCLHKEWSPSLSWSFLPCQSGIDGPASFRTSESTSSGQNTSAVESRGNAPQLRNQESGKGGRGEWGVGWTTQKGVGTFSPELYWIPEGFLEEEGCKIKVDSNVRSVFYFASPSRFARDCPGLNTPRSQRTRDHWLPSCESFLVKLEKFGDDEGVLGRKDRM